MMVRGALGISGLHLVQGVMQPIRPAPLWRGVWFAAGMLLGTAFGAMGMYAWL
jgi:hypothetical protein